MLNLTKELESTLKKDVAQLFKKSADDTNAILKSIFQSFTENDPTLSKKAQAAKESLGKSFTVAYNALLQTTAVFYSNRTTPEEVEGKLSELELDKRFIEAYSTNYTRFVEYMASPDSQSGTFLTTKNQLLDFKWDMHEALYDSESELPRVNLVTGEFTYLDTHSGNIKRFKCLVPLEMTEQIARETELALSACKQLQNEFN